MRGLAERAWYLLSLGLGRLFRSARYSKTAIISHNGERHVRKHRAFYAPLLIWMSGPLVRILDTGVRVLPQREWEARERRISLSLRGTSIRVDAGGMLVLSYLAGKTLATVLDDPALDESARRRAIQLAVTALSDFHARGFSHGDAMAENVMVDLDAGVAHWFDFETVHEPSRPTAWGRSDDLRALLVTCLVRTAPERLAETFELVVDVYADEAIIRLLAPSFTTVLRRPLAFHLGQASLSFRRFQEIARLLQERSGPVSERH